MAAPRWQILMLQRKSNDPHVHCMFRLLQLHIIQLVLDYPLILLGDSHTKPTESVSWCTVPTP
jgi:hypothetical protein